MDSEWKIYGADGTHKATATKIEYTGNWMEESFVTADEILSPIPVQFAIGDWLEYRGERFEINYEPETTKAAASKTYGGAYKYSNVKFNSYDDELTRCDFLDFTLNDNNLHFTSLPTFSFYAESVKDLADRIQANLDKLYTGEKKWTVEVHPEYASNTNRNISVDKIKVNAAFALCVSEFGCNYIRRGRTVIIGTAGLPADHLFKMRKGNGLKEIARQADSDQLIVTRLRVYGSERNLPRRYYNSLTDADGVKLVPDNMAVNHLMLPGFGVSTLDPYIDSPNIATLGIREDTVMFDGSDDEHPEIFPSIEEMTAEQLTNAGIATKAEGRLDELVGAEQISDNGLGEEKNGEIVPDVEMFQITLKDIGFDINDYWTDETPLVSFKTGMLGGREFEILQSGANKPVQNADGTWTFTLNRVYDESLKLFFPYKDYNAKTGDQFVLLHIDMPDVYIKAASQRLLEQGREYLSKHDYSRSVYSPAVDDVFMADQHRLAMQNPEVVSLHDTIREGDLMVFEDADLGIESASIFIDTITIKEGHSPIPQYEITLKEEKTVGTLQKMQNQIDSIKGGQGSGGYNAAQIRNLISLYGLNFFLSKTRADRTPYLLSSDTGFEAGRFVAGASGARIDGRGNAEVESIVVRSFMKVFELVYNRLNALEGNTSFADSGTIESITHDGGYNYTAMMRPRWEGDFTSFQAGDVVYGYVNDLRKETPDGYVPTDNEGEEDPTAQGYVYYKAWAYVSDVADREKGILKLVRYADGDDVPGRRNFPMREGMLISRWGNNENADGIGMLFDQYAQLEKDGALTEKNRADWDELKAKYGSFIVKRGTDENPKWVNTRQQSFYISCDDGNIVELYGVTRPVLDPSNYGTVLGQIPDGLARELGVSDYINPTQPYLYARGIMVQDLIRISYQGTKILAPYFRGEWSQETAESETDYYRMTDDSEDWVTYRGALYHYISTERTTLNPEEDGGAHWGRITGTLKPIWQIVPSVDKINIRDNGWSDKTIEVVVRATEVTGVTDITTPEALDAYGKELVFSLDGVTYNEFWVRQGEVIDGLGLDHSGNNIPWMEVTERILLTLRNKDTHDEAMTVSVPVIKDGEKGENGESIKGADGKSVEMRYRIYQGFPDPADVAAEIDPSQRYPSGWETTYPLPKTGESLWSITATIYGDNNLMGQWNDPVLMTGKEGAGKTGPMAYPAGAYDLKVEYEGRYGTLPVVLDGEVYYILKEGKTYCGEKKPTTRNYPHLDYNANDSETSWQMFDMFNTIFAKILMAEHALLGQAVFWDRYMFSQRGKDAYGNDTPNYTAFDGLATNAFTPNLLIDFLTGMMHCNKATITGVINADSGRIGNLLIRENSLVGMDGDKEILRLGIGEVDVEDTSTTLGVPASFWPTPNRPSATCNDQSAYWSEASIDAWREYRDNDFLDEQMDLYATLKFKLNEAVETLNIDRFGHGYTSNKGYEGRYNGRVVCTASLAKVANGTRTPIGSSWDASNAATFSNLTAGDYEIAVVVSLMPDGSSYEWFGSIYVDNGIITATTMRTDLGNRVELAKNGFLCRQGASRYLQFSRQSGFEVRFGDFGLKIDSEGIKGIKDKEWRRIKFEYYDD